MVNTSYKAKQFISTFIVLLLLKFLLVSCSPSKLISDIDVFIYQKSGSTVFSKPVHASLKQIHFGRVGQLDSQVLVKGEVVERHPLGTFLVLEDQSAKLVVDLSNIISARKRLDSEDPKFLEVLGTVERGTKGVPFFKARSFRRIESKDIKYL